MKSVSERRIIVLAPDSFKGSATAPQVAAALARGWASRRPLDTLLVLPQADGGEGTSETIATTVSRARQHRLTVTGPDGRPTVAQWWSQPDGPALVDLASAAGLPLMDRLDAGRATTTGLGELLHDLHRIGHRSICVALGGSACTDGGAGALQALGAVFRDRRGQLVTARGGLSLPDIASVDCSGLPTDLAVELLTDVTSPLLGPEGAAYRFAPQKGADAALGERLEVALRHWAGLWETPHDFPGAGAAGGTAFGLVAALGASRAPGAARVADVTGLTKAASSCDLLVTGEGQWDGSSRMGKVTGHALGLSGPARRALVVGRCAAPPPDGVLVTELEELAGTPAAARNNAVHWLRRAGAQLADRVSEAVRAPDNTTPHRPPTPEQ